MEHRLHRRGRDNLGIGEPYTLEWTGRWSIDDIRLSTTPMASRLTLAVPAEATAEECVAGTLTLVDSYNSAAALAPYDVDVLLTLPTGAGACRGRQLQPEHATGHDSQRASDVDCLSPV